MKKAFLTGVTGFVGGHLASVLAERGWEVSSVCRATSDTSCVPSCCRVERAELTDPGSMETAMAGSDAVFHLAGATSGRSSEALTLANAGGTASVLEARRRFAPEAVFVHVSSQSAAGPSGRGPITPYGRSKQLSELCVRRSAGWIIVRPPAVIGPGDEAMLPVLRLALRGVFFSPMKRGAVSLVHVHDLAVLLSMLPEIPGAAGGTIEPSYGRTFTWREMHSLLQKAAGRRVLHLRVPPPLAILSGMVSGALGRLRGRPPVFDSWKARESLADWTADGSAASGLTGWKPSTTPEEAFRQAMQFARQRL